MYFTSDNAGPAHPKVLAALAEANHGHVWAYGDDPVSARAVALVRETFEAPEAAVYLVATGTAANSLALATLTQPYETVFCSPVAHIHEDECNAPEFFTGGAKLTLVEAPEAKITPEALTRAIEAEETRGVHGPQRGPVSITNVTERGTLYTVTEIEALARVAHGYGLPVHLDGARLANALVATNASPAEMTWRAGVDALSLGGTKNGCLGVEAVVLFDPAKAREFELRRKRAGHLFSKHRYLAAQMTAYLEGGLWLDLARRANAATQALVEGLEATGRVSFLYPPQANIIFATWPRALHRKLMAAGAEYHLWDGTLDGGPEDEPLAARLVCDWSAESDGSRKFLDIFNAGE